MLKTQSFLRAFFGLVLVVSTCALQAQTAQQAYPEIQEIQVEFEGFQPVSDQYVASNIQLREGMIYNPALVDQSIRSLYGTGYFDNVDLKAEPAEDGQINIVISLVPKYTIGTIVYNGNDAYSNKRLAKKGEIGIGETLDEYQVNQAAEKILAYYIEKGYADAEVDYRIQRDRETGLATVQFDVVEENRIKIKRIDFVGNDAVKAKKLRKVMETKRRDWLSWITGSGRLDEAKFKEDLELLRQYFRNEGFLDVVIDPEKVDFHYKTAKKLYITIDVVQGDRYYLGAMSVEDMTIFTEGELLSSVELETGDAFSPAKVDTAAEAIREYYTSRGYLESRVRAERVSNMDTREIDVVFRVRESEKFYVESIKVEGNTKTKTKVIIRELALRPGDVFDMTKMQISESRLNNTRYFQDVRMNPERTNIPGRRDLSVAVREGRTGSFSFGAGFGSVESIVVFAELRQGNFDLFNWRSGFQGDGQKFRFRVSLGTQSNQILISFEEPWLFEQRLAFGTEIYRTESSYNSSEYDELRTGFELYLRRRLFELVEGRLSYRLEKVEISDVDMGTYPFADDGIADVLQAAQGSDLISKVGLTLLRDNRDNLMFTRKGNRTSLLNEWAGLGGDVNYYKFEGRMAHFIPTFDAYNQSISFVGRVGTAIPYGDSAEVPFYDRFYLGGPDTLRGYDYRDVSPRDNDDASESIGGNTYGLFSAEYSFQLAEPLALAMFYDAGFVNSEENDFDVSDYADNWGVGARILIMGSPLKLDLGFPITYPDYVDASATQFHFSFGTRF
ncbi:outer membrane protein assembly factor BamA [Coraliomargarita akajimensis]|uniref:Outer membrane protein assembly factor BamA n=1 Tax=Coraliomargarita akajimensis (strain DSM 45221 / IAM 15411 / JCM 23193 / KCTC 12865 / 04OKA010-24) TaxID=583355 RepID=D5EJK3_CORAD|nr:outer membrane protein assembly factor BamA [Coraliomargarita akajimensis]ADE54602.1 outer membrane protein assembly complex, YaeT protein [Coraliomargarita akajimensis DSM 45221]